MFQIVFQYKCIFLIFVLFKVTHSTYKHSIYDDCECLGTSITLNLIEKASSPFEAFALVTEPLTICCYPSNIIKLRENLATLVSNKYIQIDTILANLHKYANFNRYDLMISFLMQLMETLPTTSHIKQDLETMIIYFIKRKYLREYTINNPQIVSQKKISGYFRGMSSSEQLKTSVSTKKLFIPHMPSHHPIRPTYSIKPSSYPNKAPSLEETETCNNTKDVCKCQHNLMKRIISILQQTSNLNLDSDFGDRMITAPVMNIDIIIGRLLNVIPKPKYPLEREYYNIVVWFLKSPKAKTILSHFETSNHMDDYQLLQMATDEILRQITDQRVISAFKFYIRLKQARSTNFFYANLVQLLPAPTNQLEQSYYTLAKDFLKSDEIYHLVNLRFTGDENLSQVYLYVTGEIAQTVTIHATITQAFNFYFIKQLVQITGVDYGNLTRFLYFPLSDIERHYYNTAQEFLTSRHIYFYLPHWKFAGHADSSEVLGLVFKEILETPEISENIKEAFNYYYTAFMKNEIGIDFNELIKLLPLPMNEQERRYYDTAKSFISSKAIYLFLHNWNNKTNEQLYNMLIKQIIQNTHRVTSDVLEAFNFYYVKHLKKTVFDYTLLVSALPAPTSSQEEHFYNTAKLFFKSNEIYLFLHNINLPKQINLEQIFDLVTEKIVHTRIIPDNILQAFNYYYKKHLAENAGIDYSELVKFLPLPIVEKDQNLYEIAKMFLEGTQIYTYLAPLTIDSDMQKNYDLVVDQISHNKNIPQYISKVFTYYYIRTLTKARNVDYESLLPLLEDSLNETETLYFETMKKFLLSSDAYLSIYDMDQPTFPDRKALLHNVLVKILQTNVTDDIKQAAHYYISKITTKKYGFNYIKLIKLISENINSQRAFTLFLFSPEFEKIVSGIKPSEYKNEEELLEEILTIIQKTTTNTTIQEIVNVYLDKVATGKLSKIILKLLPTPKTEEEKRYYLTVQNYLQSTESYQFIKDIDRSLFNDDKFLLDFILRRISESNSNQIIIKAFKYYLDFNEKPTALDLITKKEIRRHFKLTEIFTDTLDLKTLSTEQKAAFRTFFKFISEIKPDAISNFDSWDQAHTRGEFIKLLFEYFLKTDIPVEVKKYISILQPLVRMDGRGALPP